ncbi:O-antigen ligase family protein [Sphingorhabdus lutea]|nr:O-antigen ligase family protein [Sphingorhabdus lutea]
MNQSTQILGERANGAAMPQNKMSKILFYLFFACLFLGGGTARDDALSLIILRPLAIAVIGYCLLVIDKNQINRIKIPLMTVLGLGLIMVIQLIPLPPAIWSMLPNRELLVTFDKLAGLEPIWRPISLSPSKTMNSLMALSVGLAGLLLYAIQPAPRNPKIMVVFIIAGFASTLLAFIQLSGPMDSIAYSYRITNNGSLVGFFANRNHHATMLCAIIPMIAYLGLKYDDKSNLDYKSALIAGALIMFLFPFILQIGSRSGIFQAVLSVVFALIIAAIFILNGGTKKQSHIKQDKWTNAQAVKKKRMQLAAIGLFFLVILSIAALSFYLSRAEAIDRLFKEDAIEDMRSLVLPITTKMASDFWLFGAGFGSFEHVYRIYEPHNLLRITYLNQAHNDWVQFAIEGGIFPILIIGALFIKGMAQFKSLWTARHDDIKNVLAAMAAAGSIILCIFASVGDYPVRTPIITVFIIISLAIYFKPVGNKAG